MDHIRGNASSMRRRSSARAARGLHRHSQAAQLRRRERGVALELGPDELRVKRAFVDEGPTIKRYRPRALGRATSIKKRTSHMTIELTTEGNRGSHGTEGPSRVPPGRLHPRLEVDLVQRARVLGLPHGGHPDPRSHREQARSRGPLDDHHQEEQERGRGQHPHGPPGHRDRQVRLRGGRSAQGAPQDDRQGREGEHPRDQAARARRPPRRAVDRRAAAEPRGLPARDEARAHQRDALGRQGREDPGLGPAGRRRDGAHRGLLGRPRAAAHAARGHRLRLLRGPHHLRPHRREGVDQQGRDHAQGLRSRT